MAWKSPISQDTGYTLANGDGIFVGRAVTITDNTGSSAVFAPGDGQEAEIWGTLSSSATGTLLFGATGADVNQRVEVFAGGHVQHYGVSGAAMIIYGNKSQVINAGLIVSRGGEGVAMVGDNTGGSSSLVNSGTIKGTTDTIHHFLTETFIVTNTASGLIQGGTRSFLGDSAAERINNSGRMIGNIEFAGGNDIYSGATGRLTGLVLGGVGLDTLTGGIDANEFQGGADNDILIGNAGNDTLKGDAGLDRLDGGLGRDLLTGGANRDIFDFNSKADSLVGANRDVITDFTRGTNATGDDIDLSTIDARSTLAGNQAFTFHGVAAFTKVAGQLRFTDLGATCLVQGDINGDGKADFEISVKVATLAAGDFIL